MTDLAEVDSSLVTVERGEARRAVEVPEIVAVGFDSVTQRVVVELDGVEPRATTSWSSLRGFEWCQAQWAYNQLFPQPFEPAPAGMIGSAVHSILAGLQRTTDVYDLWLDAALEMPGVIPYRKQVMEVVEKALNWDVSRNAIARGVGAERRVEGEVAGVVVRGRVDLLEDDDGLVVSDWKTNQTDPDRSAYEGVQMWKQKTDLRQVVLYSQLIDEERYGKATKVRIYHLSDEESVELDLTSEAGKHAAAEAAQFVEVNSARIESACADSAFSANASPGRCRVCAWRDVCPGSQAGGAVPVEISSKP